MEEEEEGPSRCSVRNLAYRWRKRTKTTTRKRTIMVATIILPVSSTAAESSSVWLKSDDESAMFFDTLSSKLRYFALSISRLSGCLQMIRGRRRFFLLSAECWLNKVLDFYMKRREIGEAKKIGSWTCFNVK